MSIGCGFVPLWRIFNRFPECEDPRMLPVRDFATGKWKVSNIGGRTCYECSSVSVRPPSGTRDWKATDSPKFIEYGVREGLAPAITTIVGGTAEGVAQGIAGTIGGILDSMKTDSGKWFALAGLAATFFIVRGRRRR